MAEQPRTERRRRVHFQNLGVNIHDYELGIRHTIPYDASLCLGSLRRFRGDYSRKSQIICKESRRRVKPNIPLESQGIAPGDVLCVFSC